MLNKYFFLYSDNISHQKQIYKFTFLRLLRVVNINNVKVELSAKTTLHASAVYAWKPDIKHFPACRSRGLVSPGSTSVTCYRNEHTSLVRD